MDTALVLIDIQNDYFKGGRNELVNTEQAIAHIKQTLSLFRDKGLPIFYVQHISLQENATFFLPDMEGIKIHEQILPKADEKVIVKHTPDSFFQTELQRSLETMGIKRLVICGMMSHMCIDTTVRTAKQLGYEILLLSEACSTKDLTWNNTVIPALSSLQFSHNRLLTATTRNFKDRSEFERPFQAADRRPCSSGSWERLACRS